MDKQRVIAKLLFVDIFAFAVKNLIGIKSIFIFSSEMTISMNHALKAIFGNTVAHNTYINPFLPL